MSSQFWWRSIRSQQHGFYRWNEWMPNTWRNDGDLYSLNWMLASGRFVDSAKPKYIKLSSSVNLRLSWLRSEGKSMKRCGWIVLKWLHKFVWWQVCCAYPTAIENTTPFFFGEPAPRPPPVKPRPPVNPSPSRPNLLPARCGNSNATSTRIVGGEEAPPGR